MSELESPISSWATATLGELSKVTSGIGFPKKYQGQSSGDYPVYKVGDVSRAVTQGQGKLSTANHYVTTDEAAVLKGAIFRPGSTLFAKIGEAVKLNRRAFVISPGLADNNVMAVIPFLHESDRYLHYFLRTVDLSEVSRSTTVPSVRKGDIEELRIPLPTLDEQKIIADKLDILLAQVDNTKARLERIPKILKCFRQSVLAAAVSGRLTEEWRKFNSYQLPYKSCRLAEIILEMRNGLSPKPNEDRRGHPILRISSVRPFSVDQIDIRYLEISEKDRDRYSLKPDDLLFTRYNGSIDFVGVCARVKRLDHNVLLYPDKLIRVRVDKNQVTPDFLELFAASHEARKYIYSLIKSTSGQKGISGKDLKLLEVKLPSVSEQTEIARRVDQLFAYADRIEQQVNQTLARVNNLTQSILAKAFRGELTAQWRKGNPELISGENSAEALLERIKAERAAQAPKKRTRKKATV